MREPDLGTILDTLGRQAEVAGAVTRDLPAPLRLARQFAYALEHLPIGFEPGESLAGELGWRYLNSEQREAFQRDFPPPPPPSDPALTPTPDQLFAERFHCFGGYTLAHTCADYERVVSRGLTDVLSEIQHRHQTASGPERDALEAMAVAVNAVLAFAERYAALARELGRVGASAARREELRRIAVACERVPRGPATSFHEAVQAIWLVHVAIGLSERSTASLSLGRLDQFLYPQFCRDLASGVPPDSIKQTLRDLWLKLNRFGDPACAVNLGGLDVAGRDLFNPLSRLLLEVTSEMALPSPILAARVHDGLPEDAFDALLDPRLLVIGQPTFYGELPCRQAMVRRGVAASESHRFAVNSCMGLVIPGEEVSDMWGAVLNLLLPLELALNHGRPFARDLPVALQTAPASAYPDFGALFAKFAEYAAELLERFLESNRRATERAGREAPNPFLSAITRDCVARGCDRAAGGARYHCIIVEGFGWANAADALTAIERLVFTDNRYSLDALTEAAKRDFREAEPILKALLACPKYGNADPQADAMARRVTATFARMVSAHSNGHTYYLPSYHTLNAHVWAGRKTAASLDGRRAGEPLGKNAGPMPGRNRNGLTSLLLSASALDQPALSGGQALDLSLDPALLATPESRRQVRALLLTYFRRGGLQVQVNGLTAAQLRQAMAAPDKHRDLTVRIAGYSARFVSLSREVQEEMVQRFEHGL